MTPALPLPTSFTRSRSLHNATARFTNKLVIALCCVSAFLAIGALFLILGYVLYKGFANLDPALFTNLPRDHPAGLRNAIAGTMTLILMASCIGVPLGMACGTYLAEFAADTWFAHGIRIVIDVLAGVPSIIVGILAYELVAVRTGSSSAYAGAVALGFMMCPIISKTTEEMLRLVPKALREASIGLGASKFQTLVRVVIPAASAGIITGIMLAVARVAGETAPLLFTVGDSSLAIFSFNSRFPFLHADLAHPFPSLTVKIFIYSGMIDDRWSYQAWSGMLILITLVVALNVCVRIAGSRRKFNAA
jgi:phosphate transport system permease protein